MRLDWEHNPFYLLPDGRFPKPRHNLEGGNEIPSDQEDRDWRGRSKSQNCLWNSLIDGLTGNAKEKPRPTIVNDPRPPEEILAEELPQLDSPEALVKTSFRAHCPRASALREARARPSAVIHLHTSGSRPSVDPSERAKGTFDLALLEFLVCPLSKKPLSYETSTNELINEELGIA
ncbi:Calcium/calmodulin-dependent 3',5'-cyclic nucleotide phosphodiesterase 1C [Galemys pyrenaicus]|uniref:Protein preY, mitochondrial n=1 Tax=Galemys pyrenaicus TaxID=202257 RepID=A0A8J6AAI3_GALPY|nr:Calcium/calmodulin-dependent 3',5'-cyclic nucleotide phosphodiesterase 1C [Galemys pyrenaicus]